METVTVKMPKDTYDFLMELAKEMQTQNTRGTAGPVAFAISQTESELTAEGCEDYFEYRDPEGDGCHTLESFSKDEVWDEFLEYCKDNKIPDEMPDEITFENSDKEFGSWLEDKKGYETYPMKKEQRLKDGHFFLTSRACDQHIQSNNYHYASDAHSYGIHVWRNYELEKLLLTVCGFNPQEYKREGEHKFGKNGANHAYGPMLKDMPKIEVVK